MQYIITPYNLIIFWGVGEGGLVFCCTIRFSYKDEHYTNIDWVPTVLSFSIY